MLNQGVLLSILTWLAQWLILIVNLIATRNTRGLSWCVWEEISEKGIIEEEHIPWTPKMGNTHRQGAYATGGGTVLYKSENVTKCQHSYVCCLLSVQMYKVPAVASAYLSPRWWSVPSQVISWINLFLSLFLSGVHHNDNRNQTDGTKIFEHTIVNKSWMHYFSFIPVWLKTSSTALKNECKN